MQAGSTQNGGRPAPFKGMCRGVATRALAQRGKNLQNVQAMAGRQRGVTRLSCAGQLSWPVVS